MLNDLVVILMGFSLFGVAVAIVASLAASSWARSAAPDNYRAIARRLRGLAICLFLLGVVVCAFTSIAAGPCAEESIGFVIFSAAVGLLCIVLGILQFRVAQAVSRFELQDVIQSNERLASVTATSQKWWRIAFVGAVVAGCIAFPPLLLLVALTWPTFFFVYRGRNSGQLLWVLSTAVKNNRPLGAELRAHADVSNGAQRYRLRRCAGLLDQGVSLGKSLLQVRGLLPAWTVAPILIAEESGTLATTLPALAQEHLQRLRTDVSANNPASLLVLMGTYLTVATFIVSFLMIYILPKFKHIFDGFNTELPKMTVQLIVFVDFMASYWFILGPLATWAAYAAIQLSLASTIGGRSLQTSLLKSLYPVLDGPDLLRHLARVIDSGQTMVVGLDAVARNHYRTSTRQLIRLVARDVAAGQDCWESLSRLRFITPHDPQFLHTASKSENLPWALRELAELRERRVDYRIRWLSELLQPLPILCCGVGVLFIVGAFYLPMVKLLNDLS